jgi:hypothetical protein
MVYETVSEVFFLTVNVILSFFVPVGWPIHRKIACIILYIGFLILLARLFSFGFIETRISPVILISLIFLGILLLLREEIIFIWRNGHMEFRDILFSKINPKDKLTRRCIEEIKAKICEMAEQCMIALISERNSDAIQVSRDICEFVSLLHESRMAYYLRLAIEKSDRNLWEFLNKYAESLRGITHCLEVSSEDMLEILKSLIISISPEYPIDRFALAVAGVRELRDGLPCKEIQHSNNRLFYMNFALWEKYVACETPSSIFLFYVALGSVLFLFLLILIGYSLLFVFILLILLFFFVFIPRFLLAPDANSVSWAKEIICESLQNEVSKDSLIDTLKSNLRIVLNLHIESNLIRNLRFYIEISRVVDSIDILNNIHDEYGRKLNYAFLLYCITTFPMEKIRNFTALDKENLVESSRNFIFERMDFSDSFSYFLAQWRIYVCRMFSVLRWLRRDGIVVLALAEIVLAILSIGSMVLFREEFHYHALSDLLVSLIIAYSGVFVFLKRILKPEWIERSLLCGLNFIISSALILYILLAVVGILRNCITQGFLPFSDLFFLSIFCFIIFMPNFVIAQESYSSLRNLISVRK